MTNNTHRYPRLAPGTRVHVAWHVGINETATVHAITIGGAYDLLLDDGTYCIAWPEDTVTVLPDQELPK